MNQIGLDTRSKVGAQGSLIGFSGIRGPHDGPVFSDCILSLQHHRDHRARSDKGREAFKKGARAMNVIKTLRLLLGQPGQFHRDHPKIRLLKSSNDFSDHVFCYTIGLDN